MVSTGPISREVTRFSRVSLATPAGGSSTGSAVVIGHRYKCKEIGSYARAQVLLKEGHTYLDKNGDGIACKSLLQ